MSISEQEYNEILRRRKARIGNLPASSEMWEMYKKQGSVHRVAALLGVTGDTVHQRLLKAGFRLNGSAWSEPELVLLKDWYASHKSSAAFDLAGLAAQLNRLPSNVSRKARELGLSDLKRPKPESGPRISIRAKARIAKDGHPRGSLGMKHSPESVAKISEASRRIWENRTPEQRAAHTEKSMKARIADGSLVRPRPEASWKAGWREIGGVNKYYRSRWEANYARYLEWLRSLGQILKWEHEPKTFWFDKIKRGCRTYLPDFLVVENDETEAYHEVKGWMDDRSATKIRRMKRYYPNITLIVIDGKAYRLLEKQVKGVVRGWE